MSKEYVEISAQEPFLLKMKREEGHIERIGIKNNYKNTHLAKTIFESIGVMYLVSPYLPEKITTDFYLPHIFQDLINAMYEKENREAPEYNISNKHLLASKEPSYKNFDHQDNGRALITYSGGKDSMWNLDWLSRKLGIKNVQAVHFNGMNRVASSQEMKATLNQSEKIGFSLKTIDLLNSSKNSGKNIMRSRDMFIVGLSIPLALEFGAKEIFLEGGFYPKGSLIGEPFATYEDSWKFFNNILNAIGLPTKASWRNSTGMDAVKDLLKNRPNWLPLVYNCFSPECYKPERVKKWQKIAPSFPLYEHQCGSCIKCRELNVARISYDPQIKLAKPEDVQNYIKDTIRWTKQHKVDMGDILDDAFVRHLREVAKKYQVNIDL